jgi:hypothetical protein
VHTTFNIEFSMCLPSSISDCIYIVLQLHHQIERAAVYISWVQDMGMHSIGWLQFCSELFHRCSTTGAYIQHWAQNDMSTQVQCKLHRQRKHAMDISSIESKTNSAALQFCVQTYCSWTCGHLQGLVWCLNGWAPISALSPPFSNHESQVFCQFTLVS